MRYFQFNLKNPSRLADAWRDWSGFVELLPGENGPERNKIFELDDNPGHEWLHHFHWKPPAAQVSAVGCGFVRDISLCGPSIVVYQDQFVGYGVDADQDNWRGREPAIRGYYGDQPPHDRFIDRPVLVADGRAYATWGHWIVDYLPRFAIAHDLLGALFHELAIPMPDDTPLWVIDLMTSTCGVRLENILRYQPFNDRLICGRAIIPSYAYSMTYTFHRFFREFYARLRPPVGAPSMKICVSRAGRLVAASNRRFALRERFEQMAAERGYLVVKPETMFIADQINLFSSASIVIGEHGSGMHSAVFSGSGTVVGCIGFWNPIQLHIGYALGHQNVYLTRGCIWPTAQNDVFDLAVSEGDLERFFDRVEVLKTPGSV